MADVIALMNSLVDVKGKILVPGVNDTVKAVTPEEKALYDPIEFDMVSSCNWFSGWLGCFLSLCAPQNF